MGNRTYINTFSWKGINCLLTIAMALIFFPPSIYDGHLPIMAGSLSALRETRVPVVNSHVSIDSVTLEQEPPLLLLKDDDPTEPTVGASLSETPTEDVIETKFTNISGKEEERSFHQIILRAAGQYQVDPDLIRAIIMTESGYNPRAVSKKGAMGLMQLMPETAEDLGLKDSFDPENNIYAGVRYFRTLLNRFDGNIKLALAAYNAGSTTVRQYRGIPPYKATQYYVKKVFEYYQCYKNQITSESDRA